MNGKHEGLFLVHSASYFFLPKKVRGVERFSTSIALHYHARTTIIHGSHEFQNEYEENATMVDRCVCFSRTFAELKSIAQQKRIRDVESLQRIVEFGLRCALCKPYVRRMLSTGEVLFPIIRNGEEVSD